MSYKREKPFNEVKIEHIEKLELHLKKIEKLKNVNINIRED